MSSESFRCFPIGFEDSIQVCTSVVAYMEEYKDNNIFVCVSTETSSLLSAKAPLHLPFVLHSLEKDTRIYNSEPFTSEGQTFWWSEWIFHIVVFRFIYLCFASQLWCSQFQILVGFIRFIIISRTCIPFIQMKILTLPLEKNYINFWYVNTVCLILKRYTKI